MGPIILCHQILHPEAKAIRHGSSKVARGILKGRVASGFWRRVDLAHAAVRRQGEKSKEV